MVSLHQRRVASSAPTPPRAVVVVRNLEIAVPSIDCRTRRAGVDPLIDPTTFLNEVAEVVEHHGADAAEALERRSLPPLTLEVAGQPVSFHTEHGLLRVDGHAKDALVVELDRAGFSDLLQDTASTFGLQMQGRALVRAGRAEDFLAWEPLLRSALDGRPVHRPGSIDLVGDDGREIQLERTFHRDDDRDEMGAFLAQVGYLHVAGVFTDAEMAEVSADMDAAIAAASRDDGSSWWARTKDQGWYPARILGFNHRSPALRELLEDDRFTMLGTLTDDPMVQRDPFETDAAEALLKKVGVIEGISDVVWHKDCAMGGHSRRCSGLTVGLSVTGAGPTNGELGVVAGSHRSNVAPLGVDGVDLPRIAVPTRTGDVTVHCSCTLHMSRPPVSEERRVVYSGFALTPLAGDHVVERDPTEARRERQELNGLSRELRLRPDTSTISFELD
jgi:hypothetical protein